MAEMAVHSREKERAELRRIFEGYGSVQMPAPRRIGKTWLINETAKDLAKAGWLVILIDVQGMRTEDEFLRALCNRLEAAGSIADRAKAQFVQRLRQVLGGEWDDRPLMALGKVDHKEFAELLVASLAAQDKEVVIFVDEIALFLTELLKREAEEAMTFLYRLRRLMQAHPRVRWLFTGSVGLEVVARRHNLTGALVDLQIFPLEPFTEAEARSYLDHLCTTRQVPRPFELDDAAFAHLAAELGWLAPYYLKIIADRIVPSGSEGASGRPLALQQDVDQAFETMLRPVYRDNFATWQEHIDKNFPSSDHKLLADILAICADRPEGEETGTLMTRLQKGRRALTLRTLVDRLTDLSVAGYLELQNGRWRFVSGLLRRYWLTYMCA